MGLSPLDLFRELKLEAQIDRVGHEVQGNVMRQPMRRGSTGGTGSLLVRYNTSLDDVHLASWREESSGTFY
jgi:hypothetical protein